MYASGLDPSGLNSLGGINDYGFINPNNPYMLMNNLNPNYPQNIMYQPNPSLNNSMNPNQSPYTKKEAEKPIENLNNSNFMNYPHNFPYSGGAKGNSNK
jgi:hypothetical protein